MAAHRADETSYISAARQKLRDLASLLIDTPLTTAGRKGKIEEEPGPRTGAASVASLIVQNFISGLILSEAIGLGLRC